MRASRSTPLRLWRWESLRTAAVRASSAPGPCIALGRKKSRVFRLARGPGSCLNSYVPVERAELSHPGKRPVRDQLDGRAARWWLARARSRRRPLPARRRLPSGHGPPLQTRLGTRLRAAPDAIRYDPTNPGKGRPTSGLASCGAGGLVRCRLGPVAGAGQVACLSSSRTIASPMVEVETRALPSCMMSAVRSPLASTLAIAPSSRSAAGSWSNE